MLRRTWILFRARLAMARRNGGPIAALVFLAALAAVLALLVRDALPPFPYAFFALSTGALVLAPPLLADLGALLRHDPGLEWLAAQPARASERTLARALHLLVILAALVAAWCAPFALLAPPELGAGARLLLPVLDLAQGLFLATLLVWAQALLLGRAPGLLVLLETGLMAGIVVALLVLLGHLPELARLAPGSAALAWLPPAWFAHALAPDGPAPFAVPLALGLGSLGALLFVPTSEPRTGRRAGAFATLFEPLRRLACRAWVREEERGAFELVFAALPREREVALRTVPMLGIPLAFLLLGASGEAGHAHWRDDVLSLLLFTAGIYLPLLLTHVPLSETPEAAWILRLAPRAEPELASGAIKALYVRWLVPLYLGLFGLGIALGQGALIARLGPSAALLGLLLLRLLYPRCVRDLPLSVGPEELRGEVDWAGLLTGLAAGLTLLAVLANRYLTWPAGTALAAVLGLAEGLRRPRPAPRA